MPSASSSHSCRVSIFSVMPGICRLAAQPLADRAAPECLFTENETNSARLFGSAGASADTKDAFHEYVVHGRADAVNPKEQGTKAAVYYHLLIPAAGRATVQLRLSAEAEATPEPFGVAYDQVFADRLREADAFYAARIPPALRDEQRQVARQAYAGLLWTKQFYHYVIKDWLGGDPAQPAPPDARKQGRNRDWTHLYNRDVIAMPDKWEYPWYAAWDLAFHTLPLARIDPAFAKEQLVLFLREWYMHPNGQLPAYEWALSDVNPPGACLGLLARL